MSEGNSSNLYKNLPKSVISVKNRINLVHLDHVASKPKAEKLIASSAPAFSSENVGVKYYFLDEANTKQKKAGERKKKKKPKKSTKLNSKERKALFMINKDSKLEYEKFERINQIWNQYIGTVLKNDPKDASLRLAKADFHGAKFCVIASINPSLVSKVGIVVQETKNTFKLIDKENKIRMIPKEGTLFAFGHNNSIYKLNGSHIRLSSHNRSKVKFKSKKLSQII